MVPWQFSESDILRIVHNPRDPRLLPAINP